MIDFTVLIPVFNTKAEHLIEAVHSILEQTLPSPNPIVIVDDGSYSKDTVMTLKILARMPEVQVHYLKGNIGTSRALNYGHSVIRSEYIAIMGSDDISDKDRFRKQVLFLEKHRDVDVLGTNLSSFYDHDQKRNRIYTSNHTLSPVAGKGWQTNHGTVIYKNAAVKNAGGYNEKYKRGQDVELWKRMMEKGMVFRNIPDNLYLWRRFKR